MPPPVFIMTPICTEPSKFEPPQEEINVLLATQHTEVIVAHWSEPCRPVPAEVQAGGAPTNSNGFYLGVWMWLNICIKINQEIDE